MVVANYYKSFVKIANGTLEEVFPNASFLFSGEKNYILNDFVSRDLEEYFSNGFFGFLMHFSVSTMYIFVYKRIHASE